MSELEATLGALVIWTRQAINLSTAVLLVLGLISIWFDDPTRRATATRWS